MITPRNLPIRLLIQDAFPGVTPSWCTQPHIRIPRFKTLETYENDLQNRFILTFFDLLGVFKMTKIDQNHEGIIKCEKRAG